MGVLVVYFSKLNFEESQQTKIKHEQFPSMQIDKYRTFARNVSFNNSEIFSSEKNA